MRNKIITKEEASKLFKDGMTIMTGGFLCVGTSDVGTAAIVESGAKNLTIISNDGGLPTKGNGLPIASGQVSHLIASHIGLNKMVGQKLNAGELKVTLVPQGTLAEKIRAGGAGLGGILTPTGFGTIVQSGGDMTGEPKKVIKVQGKDYLLEEKLHADVAVLRGAIVDEIGNVYYDKTARNFNQVMAFAADIVIVGADKIVKRGEMNPNDVMTPSVLVDYIIKEGN